MVTLYFPTTGAFTPATGTQLNDPLLLQLNLLIEQRAFSQMFLDVQRGLVTQTMEQYRSDVVNDAQNPPQ